MNVLWVDASIRSPEESRTSKLSAAFFKALLATKEDLKVEHLVLKDEKLTPNRSDEIEARNKLLKQGKLDNVFFRYARQFAQADMIVVSAPYWDFSFPSLLRVYVEQVCVSGITFTYTAEGAKGLCSAKRFVYLTAAGGYLEGANWGGEYFRGLCRGLFQIPEFDQVSAEGLDIEGAPVSDLLRHACDRAVDLAKQIASAL